jgi:hypothetical protein
VSGLSVKKPCCGRIKPLIQSSVRWPPRLPPGSWRVFVSKCCGSSLIAAHETIGSKDKTRVCFFDYVASPEKVVPTGFHVGRMGKPKTEFVKGTPAGNHVIRMIGENRPYTCEDIAKQPPPGWGYKTSDYKAFVSAPVAVGNVAYGLLSIDTLEVGDLKQRDEEPLMVLAGVLAVALALDPAQTSPQQPTMQPPPGVVPEQATTTVQQPD